MLQPDQVEEIQLNIKIAKSVKFFRVGSLGDGKCLLHSILFLIDDKYPKYSIPERMQATREFIDQVISELTIEKWFRTVMLQYVFDIIEALRNELSQKFTEVELDKMFQDLPMTANSSDTFIRQIGEHVQKFTDINTRLFVVNRVHQMISDIFTSYKENLHNSKELGHYEIKFISDKYRINIILFDQYKNLFYDNQFEKEYNLTIFLFNQGGVHWEPVMVQNDGNLYRNVISGLIKS
jgi:hypothetical protein